MAVCAGLIWLDSPGPVIFVQDRTGYGGRRFRMFKFRTMVPNAAQLKQQLAHLNELTWPDFKISNDPRITRVGRVLRRTSLDELPQIFNVLKGDMSLVGPRPTSFDASTYALWHTERLEVMPGLTGLWQVSGRSTLDFADRLRLDIEYIERQSVWLDMSILLRTVTAVFAGTGAC
jgi:lipopolysaccharide/colanic/teichoic acid biosynthesis glycosyltransferase